MTVLVFVMMLVRGFSAKLKRLEAKMSAITSFSVLGAAAICLASASFGQNQPADAPAGACQPWPMCAAQPQGQGGDASVAPTAPEVQRPYDPEAARAAFAAYSAMDSMMETARNFSRVMNDPKYQPILQGTWAYPKPNKKARKGDFCAAVYMLRDGAIAITGPGGKFGGAMLTFYSNKIPKPKRMSKLKVTLTQPPDPPAKVTALNFTYAAIDTGAISFVVPTIGDALKGMVDEQQFKLEFNGEQVVKLRWKGGLKARDKLRNCLKGK